MADVQSRITACWDGAAGSYESCPGHGLQSDEERNAWLDVLRGVLPPEPSDVLDIGTGTGVMAFLAHALGHRVTGIDLSAEMLAVAESRAQTTANPPLFAHGDGFSPPFPAESFDVIMHRHVLWTMREPHEALRNWRALLRPGGRLVVIDAIHPPQQEEEEKKSSHSEPGEDFYSKEVIAQLPAMQARDAGEIVRMIEAAGFSGVREFGFAPVERVEEASEWTARRYGIVAMR
jgi:ubiquinone/menaquinone biosynthesis C-methylase UbiE